MKRLLRRYTMLGILVIAAVLWVALLSIPFGRTWGVRAADGAAAPLRWSTKPHFPRSRAMRHCKTGPVKCSRG